MGMGEHKERKLKKVEMKQI